MVRHGWNHYLGYLDHVLAHGYYPTHLWLDGKRLPLEGNTRIDGGKTHEDYGPGSTAKRRDKTGKQTYSQDVLMKHLLAFIDENRTRPFFILHSTQLPHGPVDIPAVHPDFANDSRLTDVEKEYASMVRKLDDDVGAILARLERHGLSRDTIVFFASDNGHELYYRPMGDKNRGRNRDYHGDFDVFKGSCDFAGLKWTNWEGGLRTPLIARCPGRIPAGKSSDRLVATYDLMPTFAELAGARMPAGKDGVSFAPTLLGENQGQRPSPIVIDKAVIAPDGWKLVRDKGAFLLFDTAKDPGERTDRAADEPGKVAGLKTVFQKEVGSPRRDLPSKR